MRKNFQLFSQRVLSRLTEAYWQEPDPWLRDDLEIARLTVLHAARGEGRLCSPHVLASYEVLGLHPEKVWPAIQAREKALGPLEATGAPPKKPAQSVTLWREKTNAVRVSSSYGGESLLCDNTISVPMAAPSIAALYPNSHAPSSAKRGEFTYQELLRIVRHSFAPAAVRRGTLNALTARGRWPNADGPATGVICVAFDAMALGDDEGDGICSRRTAQRRAALACRLNYWRRTHKYNRWLDCPQCGAARETGLCAKCGHKGRSRNSDGSTNTKEFCRPYTFDIDIEKFLTAAAPKGIRRFCARTWKEHKQAAKRGDHPNVTEMPARKPAEPDKPEPPFPPTTAAPAEPRRKTAEHQKQERRTRIEPKLCKSDCARFMALVTDLQRGRTRHIEKISGLEITLSPGHPQYRAPMKWPEAFATVCKAWRRLPEVVSESLAYWGYEGEAARDAGFEGEREGEG